MNIAYIWNSSREDYYILFKNGYCQILVTFWAIWRQNFDNFFLGHTVEYKKKKKKKKKNLFEPIP